MMSFTEDTDDDSSLHDSDLSQLAILAGCCDEATPAHFYAHSGFNVTVDEFNKHGIDYLQYPQNGASRATG
jgi:hypothetical protein